MPKLTVLESVPARAMAVCAHPDDAEIGAGATLAKWADAGCAVTLVVCTDGGAGSASPDAQHQTVAQTRLREQQAAANILGVRDVVTLGLPDGGLSDTPEFRGEIVRLIRQYRPETMLTHDPHVTRTFLHRDHRVVGTVVQDAIYPFARDWLHYPEQLTGGVTPHKVNDLLLWDAEEPDSIVDISGFVGLQAAALAEHRSQLEGLASLTEGRNLHEWLINRSAGVGHEHPFDYGETFRQMVASG